MTFLEREVAAENARRLERYKGQVRDWLLTETQDYAYNLAVRPFPECPKLRIIAQDQNGDEYDTDDLGRTVCPPVFIRVPGPDGTWHITTPRPVGKPSGGLRG